MPPNNPYSPAHTATVYTFQGKDNESGFGGTPPGDGDLEARVKHLEEDMRVIKADLRTLLLDSAEMRGKISAVAMKSDIEAVKSDLSPKIADLSGQMKGTLGFWQFLIVTGGLVAIILKWPELFRMAGISVGHP